MHNGWLPVSVFYNWLDRIMRLEKKGQICLVVLLFAHASNGMSIEIGNMALFRCPVDPRTMSFTVGPIAHNGTPLARNLGSSLEEGHYMIYLYGNSVSIHPFISERHVGLFVPDGQQNGFLPVWPQLVSAKFKRRSRSPSQTCTPSPGGTQSRVSLQLRLLRLLCDFNFRIPVEVDTLCRVKMRQVWRWR